MSSPIGDGNGTRAGNRILFGLAAVSVALVLAAVCAVGHGLASLNDPKPTPSTSTRSTP